MNFRLTLARFLIAALGHLPLPVNHALGALIGTVMAYVPSSMRRAARVNLELCFPEMEADARRQLLRHSLRETGKTLTEAAIFWARPPRRLAPFVRETLGEELLFDALAENRGVIVAVPHLGAWELLGIYYAQRLPLHTMYRPPRSIEYDPLLREVRERGGATMHPASARGVRGVRKALERGEVTAILPDQEPAEGGVYAPFFGHPARTMTLVNRLAQRTGAVVLYGFAERLPWGGGYRVRFVPASAEVAADDPETAARAINAGVEDCVRIVPAQYQWTYRRFRRQPEGVPDPYSSHPL